MKKLLFRNLEIYFRDRATVFFSLMGTLMIFLLYILFLGNLWIGMYDTGVNTTELMDKWVMAGILSVVSVTSTSGALSIMVNDRTTNIRKDLYSSPIKKRDVIGAYMLAASFLGICMSVIFIVFAEVFIFLRGGAVFSLTQLLKVLGALILVSVSNSSVMIFYASLFRSHSAFTSSVGIINTVVGFVAGAYIPIGMFPEFFQWGLQLFPVYHGSVLMRNLMMEDALQITCNELADSKLKDLYYGLGLKVHFGNFELPLLVSFIVVIITFILFSAMASISFSKKEK